MLRVRELAQALPRLRATDLELERRALSEGDRHVAAYRVVECAVNHQIPRPDLTRILQRTLNLEGSESSLTTRRNDLQEEFYWSKTSYVRLEEEAYSQLAGELAALTSTPCPDLTPVGADAEPIVLDIRVSGLRADDVSWLLTQLTFERRLRQRDALARLILDRLPAGRHALESWTLTRLEGPWSELSTLLGAAIREEYPSGYANIAKPILHAEWLDQLLVTGAVGADEVVEGRAFTAFSQEHPRFARMAEFYAAKARSVGVLVARILRLEDENLWESILPPRGDEVPSLV